MGPLLRIENYDRLEDGGPLTHPVTPPGCSVGRGRGMDWVLPDPGRHISSHHFDISFRDGAWWLVDMSTNGTFLQGQRYRLDGPHRLSPGDRFQVGPYIVAVEMSAVAPPPSPHPPQGGGGMAWGDVSDDPWSVGGGPAPIIDPVPRPRGGRHEDFADAFLAPPAFTPAPTPAPSDVAPPELAQVEAPPVVPGAPPADAPPLTAAPRPNPAMVPRPAAAAPAPAANGAPDALVAAFCEGAGLPQAAYPDADATDLARALGQSLRIVVAETMEQLRARSVARHQTQGGERTMRQASGNNPLKFLPEPDQALEAMFLRPRAGFLNGPDGLGEAMRDLRLHQGAVFAAMQPALAKLLHNLAPEEIEGELKGGGLLGGGRKARAWETYVERWDAKVAPHENGMLDEFVAHFAAAYAKATTGPEEGH